MRKLRDTATLVGRIPAPEPDGPPQFWRHFVYVSRASPHHDALVAVLRGVVVGPAVVTSQAVDDPRSVPSPR
jgi:hypothetical protein